MDDVLFLAMVNRVTKWPLVVIVFLAVLKWLFGKAGIGVMCLLTAAWLYHTEIEKNSAEPEHTDSSEPDQKSSNCDDQIGEIHLKTEVKGFARLVVQTRGTFATLFAVIGLILVLAAFWTGSDW